MSSWVYRTRDVFGHYEANEWVLLMEWHLRVVGGLAAELSRVFSSHMREAVKQTHSIIFLNDGRLMCLRFTRQVRRRGLGISIGASQAFMGRRTVSQRGATKILGWGENPSPSSPGGDASSSPVGMEFQHPDMVFRMRAVAWDIMAPLVTQNLCQVCSFETWNEYLIWP